MKIQDTVQKLMGIDLTDIAVARLAMMALSEEGRKGKPDDELGGLAYRIRGIFADEELKHGDVVTVLLALLADSMQPLGEKEKFRLCLAFVIVLMRGPDKKPDAKKPAIH